MKLSNPAPRCKPGRLDMGADGDYDPREGARAPFDGELIVPGTTGWPGEGVFFAVVNELALHDPHLADFKRGMYFAEGARPILPSGTKVHAGQKIGAPVAHGGTGAFGNFEIGPLNHAHNDPLCKDYEVHGPLPNARSRAMILAWSEWLRKETGFPVPTDTSAAGGP